MKADERELAARRLRQIANEIGLELHDERLDRLVHLLESTVDGVRASEELVLEEEQPAFVPDRHGDEAR
jgi:ribosomal protein L12E/L44/L45/RPP1/RPP2